MRQASALVLALAFSVASATEARAHDSIVDVARRDGRFKTLLAAVEAAGLAGDLAGPGPFTVFAPVDAAFAALPAGALDRLLADRAGLRRVLLHHVARGARPAAEVVQYEAVRTLADTTLPIRAVEGGVRIGEATVVAADVRARNGIIHVIDRVLLPAAAPSRPDQTLLRVAESAGFRTLVAAVRAAGLEEALAGAGPFTVFAPSDEAFAVLPPDALEALLRDRARLARLLRHHVVPGEITAAAAAGRSSVDTLAGTSLGVDGRSGLTIAGATVVKADVLASNGVIHVVDRLLVPPPTDARQGGRLQGPDARGLAVADYLPSSPAARRAYRKTVRSWGRTERTDLVRTEAEHAQGGVRVADSEGEYQDYQATDGGVAMGGQSMRAQGFTQRYLPPLRLFPTTAREGEEAAFESVVEHTTRGSATRGKVTRRVVFEGVEAVTTPAGTFADCLRFGVHQVNRPDAEGSFVAETRETVWLARGVGEVRSVGVTELRTGPMPWLRAEVELVLSSVDGAAPGRDASPR